MPLFPPSTMKLMAWNCHGLPRSTTASALRNRVNDLDPMGIFLVETKIDELTVVSILCKVDLSLVIDIPPVGCSGGFSFLLATGSFCFLLFNSQNILHFLIKSGHDLGAFLCSFVYGPILWRQKVEF